MEVYVLWSGERMRQICQDLQLFLEQVCDPSVNIYASQSECRGVEQIESLLTRGEGVVMCISHDAPMLHDLAIQEDIPVIEDSRLCLLGFPTNSNDGPLPKNVSLTNFSQPDAFDGIKQVVQERIDSNRFEKNWKDLQDRIEATLEHESRQGRVMERAIRMLAGEHQHKPLANTLRHFREHPDIYKACRDLSDSFARCVDNVDTLAEEGDGFVLMYLDQARRSIDGLVDEVSSLANGVCTAYHDENTRDFYCEQLFPHITFSLWTTNISAYEGSHGRRPDAEIINRHRDAHERGVDLTRVFVFDTPYHFKHSGRINMHLPDRYTTNLREDNQNLPYLMEQQADAGVNVYAIDIDSFNDVKSRNEDKLDQVGCDDFMIVDDRYLYLTKTSKDKSRVKRIELKRNDAPALRAARRLQRAIMEHPECRRADETWMTEFRRLTNEPD